MRTCVVDKSAIAAVSIKLMGRFAVGSQKQVSITIVVVIADRDRREGVVLGHSYLLRQRLHLSLAQVCEQCTAHRIVYDKQIYIAVIVEISECCILCAGLFHWDKGLIANATENTVGIVAIHLHPVAGCEQIQISVMIIVNE